MPTGDRAWSRLTLPAVGLALGVATSYAQQWLAPPWASLANAASPWLTLAWLVGMLQRNPATAAVAGALTCAAEVAGYYGASAARGFGVSDSYVAFWLACALTAGPLFGACGRWARERGVAGSVGAAAIPATFLGEALGSYVIRLGYAGDAMVFAGIGVLTAAFAVLRAATPLRTATAIVVGAAGGTLVYGFALTVLG